MLDRDLEEPPSTPGVFVLPVSMIENLVLDPDPLWEAVQSVIEKTPFRSRDDLAAALDSCIDGLLEEEVGRRVAASLGPRHFHPPGDLSQIVSAAEAFGHELASSFASSAVQAKQVTVRSALEAIGQEKRRREMYNGKRVLDSFYRAHLHASGMSKGILKFEAARHARARKSVKNFFDELMSRIDGM